jgi:hypothetical protein
MVLKIKAKGDLVILAGEIYRLEIAGVTYCTTASQFDRKSGNEHYVVTKAF